MHLQLILSRNKSSLNDGGIAAILNLAISRGRTSTNQTFFAGEGKHMFGLSLFRPSRQSNISTLG